MGVMTVYEIRPITFKDAKAFVNEHHRHNVSPQGHKFSIGLYDGELLIGVVMVGRPIARNNDDGITAEVIRCCVIEGYKNANSMLYGAAWRTAKGMGYKKIITYTLVSESGISLKAAGWEQVSIVKGREKGWDVPSRPRVKAERYPTEDKIKWEKVAV
jgi:hypothetical protein